MFYKEAVWLGRRLQDFVNSRPDPRPRILNIGSQSLTFRTQVQPHISQIVFAPVEPISEVVHIDLFDADGVDAVLDITSGKAGESLTSFGAQAAVVSNLLEHVSSVGEAVRNLRVLLGNGTTIFVSGPRFFPRHPDPIDNMFRPTFKELKSLFSGFNVIEHQIFLERAALTAGLEPSLRPEAWRWWRTQQYRGSPSRRLDLLSPVSAFGAIIARF